MAGARVEHRVEAEAEADHEDCNARAEGKGNVCERSAR